MAMAQWGPGVHQQSIWDYRQENGAPVSHRADQVSAIATGIGIGLMSFMVTWTAGARVTERMFERPTSAYVAMGTAILVGVLVSALAAWRLLRTLRSRATDADNGVTITP